VIREGKDVERDSANEGLREGRFTSFSSKRVKEVSGEVKVAERTRLKEREGGDHARPKEDLEVKRGKEGPRSLRLKECSPPKRVHIRSGKSDNSKKGGRLVQRLQGEKKNGAVRR